MTVSNGSVMALLIISHKHYHGKSAALLQQGSSGLMKLAIHSAFPRLYQCNGLAGRRPPPDVSHTSHSCALQMFGKRREKKKKGGGGSHNLARLRRCRSHGNQRETWARFQIGNETVAPLGHSCASNNISSFLRIRVGQKCWFWNAGCHE